MNFDATVANHTDIPNDWENTQCTLNLSCAILTQFEK